MGESRGITAKFELDMGAALKQLEVLENKLGLVANGAQEAEEAGRGFGAQMQAGAQVGRVEIQKIADGMQDVSDAAEEAGDTIADSLGEAARSGRERMDGIEDNIHDVADEALRAGDAIGARFKQMGAEADGFGQAVSRSMGTVLKEGGCAAQSIKAGFDGAWGHADKRLTGFVKNFKAGAKNIGTAILHPVKTIKDKLGAALLEAGSRVEDVGDEADDARKDLNDMGEAGAGAGSQIKDALRDAFAAFVGVEAIKAGIETLKGFVGTAIEAAGAAENTAAKFDALFAGTDVGGWADNFSDAVHRSQSEVESFLVANKKMYSEMGLTGDAANELSKITTSLAYDFGNAFSMVDADALSLVQDAISGNTAALEEYGIHIDDAALSAAALEMGLGAQIDALDDAAMAQVRLSAMLGQTDKVQRAAAESTGGLVNSTKSLNGIWGDFLIGAGAQFAPVIESIMGAVLDAWPTVEPMLMQLVTMLSDGMSQAAPVLIELGQSLIPTVITVLGTLFDAATPIISVIENIMESLTPVITLGGDLVSAILPPAVQLLGNISPILDAMSPVLDLIGGALGTISDVLGKVVGWLSDGVGKVAGFFGGIFGGAKDSEAAVGSLSGSISSLGAVTGKETSLTVDTAAYKKSVEGAAETTAAVTKDSADRAQATTGASFEAMGAVSASTYGAMQADASTAWGAMADDAESGALRVTKAFDSIRTAATAASGAANISVGASIPHHARGTDNFEGGLTYINEEGGEIAMLPSGTAIIPADKSEQLINNVTNQTTNSRAGDFNPTITINVQGSAAGNVAGDISERLRAMLEQFWNEKQEQDYMARAIQRGYA